MLKNPDSDQPHYNPDATWWMLYSPLAGRHGKRFR